MGIDLAADGKVHVAGGTTSGDFNTTANAHQGSNAGKYDAFVVALGGVGPAPQTTPTPEQRLYLPLVFRR